MEGLKDAAAHYGQDIMQVEKDVAAYISQSSCSVWSKGCLAQVIKRCFIICGELTLENHCGMVYAFGCGWSQLNQQSR